MLVTIVVEVPDHADQELAERRLTQHVERVSWSRRAGKRGDRVVNDFARIVEYRREETVEVEGRGPVQIVLTLRDDVDLERAEGVAAWMRRNYEQDGFTTVAVRLVDQDVTTLATQHEVSGKLEFDGITYGVEVSKDEDRRTNVRFTSDPPFSRTYDRVVYEWTGRLEKDR